MTQTEAQVSSITQTKTRSTSRSPLAAAADSLESSKAASRTDVFDYIESLLLIDGAPRLEEREGHALQKCRWRGKNGKELRSFGFGQPFGRQRIWLNDAR